ncbi:ribosome biogenesis GTPase Der [uncultured Sneathiella sp.]|mgnify:CR=1 FL=1|uniref:ribosome biogenesis GTPase Der n=1 Tax=uncultured Sneathiella sp. TaxID=879315 RepID=UPI0030EEA3B0|tara:strand:- start:16775 stop:18124 length:1350 start_codon:yes stop_codon:yes gene_type:complete
MTFTVAIIGRPNVGKSTLFNRLVGKKLALVDNTPGVTRDRREGEGSISNLNFRVIDTAGLEEKFDDSLEGRMRRQTEIALEEADVALMLIDAKAGVTPLDEHFAGWLRRAKTPVILVANKCEGKAGEPGLMESYALGLGDPVALSAEHGEGMAELFDALLPYEKTKDEDGNAEDAEDAEKPLQLAIVGRPNAGKSTLVNYLIGEERMLTGPEAGVTRDAIAVEWEFEGRAIKLVDTAGLRKKARVQKKLEKLSVADSLRVIRMAEVVVLMIDAEETFEKQDLTIAAHVIEEGRALVIAVNKWDKVKDRQGTLKLIRDRLSISLPQVRGIPVITLSALSGRGVEKLMPAVLEVYALWNSRISTARLNRWLEIMLEQHPPPMAKGRRLKIRYMTQVKARPPTFSLFMSSRGELPESYLRYLVNGLRQDFNLPAVPIRIFPRTGKNPYADKG